jgi:hypothetical protein
MKESIKIIVNKVVSRDSTLWVVMRMIYHGTLHGFQDVHHRIVKKDSIFLKVEMDTSMNCLPLIE